MYKNSGQDGLINSDFFQIKAAYIMSVLVLQAQMVKIKINKKENGSFEYCFQNINFHFKTEQLESPSFSLPLNNNLTHVPQIIALFLL